MNVTFSGKSMDKMVRKVPNVYGAKGGFFDTKQRVELLPGNRPRLKDDVRRTLKLDHLEVGRLLSEAKSRFADQRKAVGLGKEV